MEHHEKLEIYDQNRKRGSWKEEIHDLEIHLSDTSRNFSIPCLS